MKSHLSLIIFCVAFMFGGCSSSRIERFDRSRIPALVRFADAQLKRSIVEIGDSLGYPRATNLDGTWKTVQRKDWTSGFFPGSLWHMYELTKDESYRASAEKWTQGLSEQQYLTTTHDIGFIMCSSFGNGYRLLLDESYKPILLQAARSLTTRYNANTGCIRSWDNRKWKFPVIIDNMMNLELLFWASKHGGTQQMYDIAMSHAVKTMENHFRPDGSTYHVVAYDTSTGNVISKETHQGYSSESVWARGQAWAIYGFTMAYRETKDERFLQTARKAADWFINHLPADHVPYWDFHAPGIPNEVRDASAAAIASSGLFELATMTNDNSAAAKYSAAAEGMLSALCSAAYLAEGTNSHGIVNHACGNHPAGSEIDVSLIYGDYYFLEALLRYKELADNSPQTTSAKSK